MMENVHSDKTYSCSSISYLIDYTTAYTLAPSSHT
jgi:hypothetical protein